MVRVMVRESYIRAAHMRLHNLVQPAVEKGADENRQQGLATAAAVEQPNFAATTHSQPLQLGFYQCCDSLQPQIPCLHTQK
jgi:hypothetical protein